jgi:hypothetical protein
LGQKSRDSQLFRHLGSRHFDGWQFGRRHLDEEEEDFSHENMKYKCRHPWSLEGVCLGLDFESTTFHSQMARGLPLPLASLGMLFWLPFQSTCVAKKFEETENF